MIYNIRNISACFFSCLLILRGRIKNLKVKSRKGELILSVYFHNPSKKLFEKSVKWFLKNGFHFISVDELEDILKNKKKFPASAVIFTVDDGWKENKSNIFPTAIKYKIPVTIFISTQPVESGDRYWWSYIEKANKERLVSKSVSELKYVTNNDRIKIVNDVKDKIISEREAMTILELQEYKDCNFIHFGAHTVTHPILTQCEDHVSSFEISESQKKLKDWLGYNINSFAYPNGNYAQREIEELKKSNYKIAFTTVPRYITSETQDSIFEIPRFDVLEEVSFIENTCRMTGVWFNRKINKF